MSNNETANGDPAIAYKICYDIRENIEKGSITNKEQYLNLYAECLQATTGHRTNEK